MRKQQKDAIKDYTTSISPERTIGMIEKELVNIGISHIEKWYVSGEVMGILFSIELLQKMTFRIPARVAEAEMVLAKIPAYKNKKKDWLKEQAKRTAWRIIFHWIEAQVAMVILKQAEAMEVFLPYVYNPKNQETFYERIKSTGYKMLTMKED